MVSSFSYIEQLEKKIHTCASLKCKDFVLLNSVVEKLGDVARNNNPIEVGFSHGDLQAGNIWVDDNNNLFIIDWESWSVRSIWYDQAVLFEKLRPGSIKSYLYSSSPNSQKAIVLLEDIVFHLNELNSLPDNFGEKSFYQYVDEINTWLSEDTTNEQKK